MMKKGMMLAGMGMVMGGSTASGLAPLHQKEKVIPSQYIVVFKEGASVASHLKDLKTLLLLQSQEDEGVKGEVLHEYSIDDFQGYAIRCQENVLDFIRNSEVVDFVEEDQVMSIYAVQNNPPSWGLDRTSQRNLPLSRTYSYPNSAGSGVNMYTIDTGIYLGHSDYAGRVRWGYNAVPGSSNDDKNGHGTHCSGTMAGTSYGIAKKANLIAVKVLGDNGSGSNSGVIAGVDWVANQSGSRKVANMSLGGGASTALDNSVNSAVNKGTHIAVAAGNSNANACNSSPARAANAVCVGSTDSADRKSSFSNHGSCVDINAPGSSITSTWIGGSSARNTISGTSMAAPHVSGVMSLYLSEGKTPSKRNLQDASTKNTISGLPSGTVNYLLYSDANLIAASEEQEQEGPKIYF